MSGSISDSTWGGHSVYLLRRLGLENKARKWVRENALVKGSANMTSATFADYCNDELFFEEFEGEGIVERRKV